MSLVPYNVYRIRRPKQLPLPVVPIDITNGVDTPANGGVSPNTPLVADGIVDDTATLKAIALDTNVTNWYIPSGKTAKLQPINTPSHLVAIYGEGTVLAYTKNTDPKIYINGVFTANAIGKPMHKDFIIDGLHFEATLGWTSKIGTGFIVGNQRGGNYDGFTVRHCTFDGTNAAGLGGIKAFTIYNAKCSNLRIHDNTFNNIRGNFDIEVGGLVKDNITPNKYDLYPNARFFNNKMYNETQAHGSFSFVNANSPTAEVYNNYMENYVEIIVGGTKVHHNKVLSTSNIFAHSGTTNRYHSTEMNPAEVFNNHFETTDSGGLGRVYFYNGSECIFHDNFVKGSIVSLIQTTGGQVLFPNVYNNTIVKVGIGTRSAIDFHNDISAEDAVSIGNANDNEIYIENGGKGIYTRNIPTTANNGDNTVYVTGTTSDLHAFDVTGTSQNNVKSENYTGKVPTSRTGAGLLPDITPIVTLGEGKYGPICSLYNNTFTQADLTAMTAKPELLIGWYLGTAVIPSGIVKEAEDKVYYPVGKEFIELSALDKLVSSGSLTEINLSKYGAQALLLKENASGMPTALAQVGTIEGGSDGRYVELPLVGTNQQKHLVTKCLKEIKGDVTSVVDIECTGSSSSNDWVNENNQDWSDGTDQWTSQ